MNKRFEFRIIGILAILVTMLQVQLHAQTRVSGFVRDQNTGERLIGANVLKSDGISGTATDNNGYFSMVVQAPTRIKVSYVGYTSAFVSIDKPKDTVLQVNLEPGAELDAVVIRANRRPLNNVTTMKMQEIRELPTLGGKPDVLKSLQLLPGVMSQNEGSSLLLVRGGDPGQNMYLFDNVPVIYVNHLGGFMSVFNPDIISSIDLYKAGFPARYGGRLSSVLDISQRDGDRHTYKSSFSAGLTDLSFSLEGPTPLKNSSFILTGRKTLTEALMGLYSWLSEANDFIVGYGFHDLNGKFSWQPDERNSFHVNLYQGDDYLHFWSFSRKEYPTYVYKEKTHIGNTWGNWLGSARWNRVISPRLFMTNTLSYTRYRLNLGLDFTVSDTARQKPFDRRYISSVGDLSYRTNLKYQLLKFWQIETGFQASSLTHVPNSWYQSDLEYQNEGEKLSSFELAAYLENNINIVTRFQANLGLRLVSYKAGSHKSLSLEPRVRLNLNFAPDQDLQFTYQRVSQNQQLLFTSGAIMNNEIWLPAMDGIEAAFSDQYTLGWNGSFANGKFLAEVTGYYKTMNNLATYREGYTHLMGDSDWRNKVVAGGKGISKGVEFLLKKQYGDFTGFISYAYSHTTRQFPQINKGEAYLFEYDRPHSFSLNLSKVLNPDWTFNLVWVYQTGLPYTPVIGRQLTLNTEPDDEGNFGYYEALLYGERNSARMKDYHRLDIGFTYTTITRNNREAIWTFSVYNLYNRQNPFYYYYNTKESGDYERPERLTEFKPTYLYQMSFFPIIPSVSYKLFFQKTAQDTKSRKGRVPGLISESNATQKSFKWKLKAGYTRYPGLYWGSHGLELTFPNYNLEAGYRLHKSLEAGMYLGYSKYTITSLPDTTMSFSATKVNAPFFGMAINFQPLDLIIPTDNPRLDFYLLARYGGFYVNSREGWVPSKGVHFDMHHGAGIEFYLSKKLGLFAEGLYTKANMKPWSLKGGVCFRF